MKRLPDSIIRHFCTVNIVSTVVKGFMNPLKLFVIVTKIIVISTVVSYFYLHRCAIRMSHLRPLVTENAEF